MLQSLNFYNPNICSRILFAGWFFGRCYPDWYNRFVANLFLIQFIGVVLVVAGMIALMAATHLFGTPLTRAERRRASDEWNRRKDLYRLPFNFEVIVASIVFLGGIGILMWSGFNFCAFLVYWLPSLPEAVSLLLACR